MLSIFITPTWTKSVSSKTLDEHHYQDNKNSEVPKWNHNFYFWEQFLCPQGLQVIPQISPLVHPPVRKKNLDHMYIGKYAL